MIKIRNQNQVNPLASFDICILIFVISDRKNIKSKLLKFLHFDIYYSIFTF
jgi:hypothetical protein